MLEHEHYEARNSPAGGGLYTLGLEATYLHRPGFKALQKHELIVTRLCIHGVGQDKTLAVGQKNTDQIICSSKFLRTI